MRSLVVISAGLSTPSSTSNVSDTIARAVSAAVTARGESLEIHLVELSELIPDLSTALSTGIGTPRLEEVKQKLSSADALVAVTPVFKASYSGLFKTFFDVLDAEALVDMPVLIGATAGTARHSLVLDFALRPLFTYMRAIVVCAYRDFRCYRRFWWRRVRGDSHKNSTSCQRVSRAYGQCLLASRWSRRFCSQQRNETTQ